MESCSSKDGSELAIDIPISESDLGSISEAPVHIPKEGESESPSEDDVSREKELRHTAAEKRRMRNNRKKRMRAARHHAIETRGQEDIIAKRLSLVHENLQLEEKLRMKAEGNAAKYQGMARTYFDRFCWEVQQRKAAIRQHKQEQLQFGQRGESCRKTKYMFNEINPKQLHDPVIGDSRETLYLGRGSFGIVRLQIYRDLKVAVKEYLPRSIKNDVEREAAFLTRICHSYLPLLIGVCTEELPYRLVMQFHGIGSFKATTMWKELQQHELIPAGSGWLILTIQLLEAVQYLVADQWIWQFAYKGGVGTIPLHVYVRPTGHALH